MGCAEITFKKRQRIVRRIISAQRLALDIGLQPVIAALNIAMSAAEQRSTPPPPDFSI